MSTDQQYRVIGKSGPGNPWRALSGDTMIKFAPSHDRCSDKPRLLGECAPVGDWWDQGLYEILEAIAPPRAAPVVCETTGWVLNEAAGWSEATEGQSCCEGVYRDVGHEYAPAVAACSEIRRGAAQVVCFDCGILCGALIPAKAQQETAKLVGVNRFECPRCKRHLNPANPNPVCLAERCVVREAKQIAVPNPQPAPGETRLERWRREHKGYSHGTMDQRLHDANVAALMVGIDGPRSPYVPPPTLPAWTPRDLDGDIPDAWEPGGARLGGTR